ncbi:hypothetical protein ACEUT7_16415 [Escherichia coli]|jgi:hypothetical protein
MSCIALVSDAAANTVIFPSSASALPATAKESAAPVNKFNHLRAIGNPLM